MKNASLLLVLFFLFILSCKKEADPKPVEVEKYTKSTVIASDLLPISGGFIDEQGILHTYSPPTFLDASSSNTGDFLSLPECRKYDKSGKLQGKITIPGDKMDFYYASATGVTINDTFQYVPSYFRLNFVKNSSHEIIYSNFRTGKISKLLDNYTINIVDLEGVVSITIDHDTIYALTSQVYDRNLNLIIPPKIFKITSYGDCHEFFSFPSSYNYPSGNTAGSNEKMYPLESPNDIIISKSGDILVAFGSLNTIFKISQNKQLETLVTNITMPVSLAMDTAENLFVVSGPVFAPTTIEKPFEIIEIKKDRSRKLIYKDTRSAYKYVSGRSNLNINIGLNGELFLENALAGEILVIE